MLEIALAAMTSQTMENQVIPTTGGSMKTPGPLTSSAQHGTNRPATSSYPATITLPSTIRTSYVRPYPSNLTLLPSPLRPHCPARARLTLWKPVNARTLRDSDGVALPLSEEAAERMLQVLGMSFAPSTLSSYGAGLLTFHVFCDSRNIPDSQRAPVSTDLLSAWIATMAGTYAGASVRNYVAGLRAWSVIHGVDWKIQQDQLDTILRGAEKAQPVTAQKPQREPFTVSYIEDILSDLDTSNPLDAAVAACLTTSFYCVARLGELTVPSLKSFNPLNHVTPAQVRTGRDKNGFECTIIHVPHTKADQQTGEDIYFPSQLGDTDPSSKLRHHMELNKPTPSEHLFTYTHTTRGGKATRNPLTKPAFLSRIHKAAKRKGRPALQGHGIRIGATLEYLLRGVSFEAVKVLGRWKSDAFLKYLRKHAEIMAPYLQPQLHEELLRYTLPPVRH